MLLYRRLLRGTTALSSSTPSLLRLPSVPQPTTRPSLPPRPKIHSFGRGLPCPSCTCTPSSCGCLCCRLCRPSRTQLSRRPLLQTKRGGFVARRVPTEVRGTGRALPWGLLLHPVHPAPDALCSPTSADRRSCGGVRRACSEKRQQRGAPQAVRVAPVLRARTRYKRAPYTPTSYWARGTHGRRRSSPQNTHLVSSCTVSPDTCRRRLCPALHSVQCWGAAHQRPLRLEVRLQQHRCPSHGTTTAPTSHARVGPPSPKCCGCRGFPRPFQRECWAGGRAHSNPARWGATSWRSKATPFTDRMRSRRYDTPRTFCSHPPTEYR